MHENEEEGMLRDMCHRKNKSSLATGWMWWGSGQGWVGLGHCCPKQGPGASSPGIPWELGRHAASQVSATSTDIPWDLGRHAESQDSCRIY